MTPTLTHGELIVATSLLPLKFGAVVIVLHEGKEKVKRIEDITPQGVDVRGDNPGASTDSRHFGRLATDAVIARVVWPRARRRQPTV